MLEVVEYLYVYLVIWTVLFEKLSKTVVEVVLLCKLEDRFLCLLAEPYDSLADELRCPFAWTDKPRSNVSCKKACRVLLYVE